MQEGFIDNKLETLYKLFVNNIETLKEEIGVKSISISRGVFFSQPLSAELNIFISRAGINKVEYYIGNKSVDVVLNILVTVIVRGLSDREKTEKKLNNATSAIIRLITNNTINRTYDEDNNFIGWNVLRIVGSDCFAEKDKENFSFEAEVIELEMTFDEVIEEK